MTGVRHASYDVTSSTRDEIKPSASTGSSNATLHFQCPDMASSGLGALIKLKFRIDLGDDIVANWRVSSTSDPFPQALKIELAVTDRRGFPSFSLLDKSCHVSSTHILQRRGRLQSPVKDCGFLHGVM